MPTSKYRITETEKQLFLGTCRGIIKDRLAIPESASFTDQFESGSFTGHDQLWAWYGAVTAKNVYGTVMRASFQCIYYPQTRITKLGYFDADISLLKVSR